MAAKKHHEEVLAMVLAASAPGDEVTLDALGEAFGTRAVTADEIGEVIDALESAGRKVVSPAGGGIADLREVVIAAREIRQRTGRSARIDEVALQTGLDAATVRRALLLAAVMGR